MVLAADFYVITATSDSQEGAQVLAAERGGWVLDTDAYTGLQPNRFTVVRGPFATSVAAGEELETLSKTAAYKGAYVKDAGSARLPGIGNAPPALLAALLGEVLIEIDDRPGSTDPCEPQEPYQRVRLSYAGVGRQASGEITSGRIPLDIGTFSIIKRTGEIDRMRACFE